MAEMIGIREIGKLFGREHKHDVISGGGVKLVREGETARGTFIYRIRSFFGETNRANILLVTSVRVFGFLITSSLFLRFKVFASRPIMNYSSGPKRIL